jgi:hypothetical protein
MKLVLKAYTAGFWLQAMKTDFDLSMKELAGQI